MARNTNESIFLCEAAGYDTIFVETVGVGQSETAIAEMVDMVALVVPPGDELQGIKRGIMEFADLLLVNKSDGELAAAAIRAKTEYISALKFLRPRFPDWRPEVVNLSSKTQAGIPDTWATMQEFFTVCSRNGSIKNNRRYSVATITIALHAHLISRQARQWMWRHLEEKLVRDLKSHDAVKAMLPELEARVVAGAITSGAAADEVIRLFYRTYKPPA